MTESMSSNATTGLEEKMEIREAFLREVDQAYDELKCKVAKKLKGSKTKSNTTQPPSNSKKRHLDADTGASPIKAATSETAELFTFIDLFAGIGGFRYAMQNLGGRCVFSSEWDEHSQKTYYLNFGERPAGDITLEETKAQIPNNFDILCAGFPCQAFSIAGKRGGFEDTRGTLFFEVAEILKRKRPKAFFLENVKGLFNHRGGKTLERIIEVLRVELNYFVPDPEILNAKDFGVPQNRERVFIVGFRKDLGVERFAYPKPTGIKRTFADVKEENPVPTKYYLSEKYLEGIRRHRARHESKGNGFGYEIIEDDKIANAIVVGGMGRERNLVRDDRITDFTPQTNIKGRVNREYIRRMTPREWARLQGFPEEPIFRIPVADVHAYKQFGNSVAIPAVQATGKAIINTIRRHLAATKLKTKQQHT